MNSGIIHFVVHNGEHGLLLAKVVELKLVVAGRDQAEIVDEITRAIRCHYEFAILNGVTPFATLFQDKIEAGELIPTGAVKAMELPPEVPRALLQQHHPDRVVPTGVNSNDVVKSWSSRSWGA